MGSDDPTRETLRGERTPNRRSARGAAALLLMFAIAWAGARPLLAIAEPLIPAAAALPSLSAASESEKDPEEPNPPEPRVAMRERPRTPAKKRPPRAKESDRASAYVQQWMPSRGSECIKRGPNRGFCAGPRRVPKPHGTAADLARRLGLGEREACAYLLFDAPLAAWVAAAQRSGKHAQLSRGERPLLWPVENGVLLRGTGNLTAARKRREAMFLPAKASPTKPVRNSGHHPHEGLDIGANPGTPIRAARGGLVVYSDNTLTGYGNLVILVHPDGTVAFYAHCRATYVFAGQQVERGQVVGEVGETGFARGAHLHFEYRGAGRAADPMPLFASDDARR